MINERQLLQIFRVTRHDWLNHLQLIKANGSLGRLDQIDAIINQIVEGAQMESNLTNLKAEKFTAFLLLHKTLETNYPMELEVEALSLDLTEHDEELTRCLETLMDKIKTILPSARLMISIYQDELGLCISLSILLKSFGNPGHLTQLKEWLGRQLPSIEMFEDAEAVFFNLNVEGV